MFLFDINFDFTNFLGISFGVVAIFFMLCFLLEEQPDFDELWIFMLMAVAWTLGAYLFAWVVVVFLAMVHILLPVLFITIGGWSFIQWYIIKRSIREMELARGKGKEESNGTD